MLENWLHDPKLKKEEFAAWQIGANIITYRAGGLFPDIKETKIALLGVGEETDTIRKHLYRMSFTFGKLPIADIGNLRNPTEEGLLPVIKELLEAGIIPIILSAEPNPFTAQYKAYQDKTKKLNLVIIEDKIAYHKDAFNYLSVIRKVRRPRLHNLGFVGYQTHLSPSESIKYYQKKNYDCVRLGMAKRQMELVEPVIRDAQSIYFNLSAIKQGEAAGLWENSASGFTSEEACQLCHYAGMSDKLTSIGFYGYAADKDPEEHTAQVIAQLIWYTLEGVYLRKKDFPASTDRMVEYIVPFKQHDYDLTFWKSTKSGRWWVQLEVNAKKSKNQLVPCAYEDYQLACKSELSERLLNIIERFA